LALVNLKNICKTYDNKKLVIDNLSFTVDNNDFFVLIGASGSGKTTILNLIAGLEDINSGEIYINDVLSNNIEPKDRDIAMVFQNYALYPHMTVFENLAFALRNKKENKKEIKNRVVEIAEKLRIDKLLDRKPAQLSGGQKQRVAIGRAIVRNPKIFLMDEPLSNLDVVLRNQLRKELKQLHKDFNATIIYVTHDQIEALSLATKIMVLKDGHIEQIGTPIEIFENPQNQFVAQFLGTPKMNIINNLNINYKNNKKFINIFNQEIELPNIISKPQTINLGIRPENFIVCNKKSDIGTRVSIKYAELIGSEYIIYSKMEYKNNIYQIVFNI
jgi:multiple sugar transport system ATP-binding protein